MIAIVRIAMLLGVLQTPQPSPTPSLPPEIIHTVSSETCTALSSLLLPVGYASKTNDQGFDAMSTEIGGYMSHMMFGDDPHIVHPSLDAAFDGSKHSSAAPATVSSGPDGDDPIAYGPDQTIKMSHINVIAGQLAGNITYERKLLAQSYAAEPRGKSASLDALRQKTENLIETQSALLQRFQGLASLYLENIGESGMECGQRKTCMGTFNANLRALLFGSTIGLDTSKARAISGPFGSYKDAKGLAKDGSAGEVIGAMRFNEGLFSTTLIDTYNQCRGTHYVVNKATPAPTPRPS